MQRRFRTVAVLGDRVSFFGVAVDDHPEVERLLAHVISRTGGAVCRFHGDQLTEVLITRPHLLAETDLVPQLCRRAAEPDEASEPVRRHPGFFSDSPAGVRHSVVPEILQSAHEIVRFEESGVVLDLRGRPYHHRFIILTEVYFALAPDHAPEIVICGHVPFMGSGVAVGYYEPRDYYATVMVMQKLAEWFDQSGYPLESISPFGSADFWGVKTNRKGDILPWIGNLLAKLDFRPCRHTQGGPSSITLPIDKARQIGLFDALWQDGDGSLPDIPDQWPVSSVAELLAHTAPHYCRIKGDRVVISIRELEKHLQRTRIGGLDTASSVAHQVLLIELWNALRPEDAPVVRHDMRWSFMVVDIGYPVREFSAEELKAIHQRWSEWLPELSRPSWVHKR